MTAAASRWTCCSSTYRARPASRKIAAETRSAARLARNVNADERMLLAAPAASLALMMLERTIIATTKHTLANRYSDPAALATIFGDVSSALMVLQVGTGPGPPTSGETLIEYGACLAPVARRCSSFSIA